MIQEPTIKEKSRLKECKLLAEELSTQLHLAIPEAKDEFEIQKQNLVNWLESIENKLGDGKNIGEEKVSKLKSVIEKLQVQAALAKAETEDGLKEQQQKIAEGIQKLKQEVGSIDITTEEKTERFTEEVNKKLDDFNTKFDLFRLQLHLGKEEAKEIWHEKKKRITEELRELKSKLETSEDFASENWDVFSSEMSAAWKHVTQAFKSS